MLGWQVALGEPGGAAVSPAGQWAASVCSAAFSEVTAMAVLSGSSAGKVRAGCPEHSGAWEMLFPLPPPHPPLAPRPPRPPGSGLRISDGHVSHNLSFHSGRWFLWKALLTSSRVGKHCNVLL